MAVSTTVIMRLGRKRYAWVTGIPCILMAIVAIAADFENVFNSYIPAGKWILVAFSAAMFLMILIVLVESSTQLDSLVQYSSRLSHSRRN